MRLAMLAKDPDSGYGGCPSVYLADDGGLVVQGHLLDTDTLGQVQHLRPGEGAVHIEARIVTEALRLLQDR